MVVSVVLVGLLLLALAWMFAPSLSDWLASKHLRINYEFLRDIVGVLIIAHGLDLTLYQTLWLFFGVWVLRIEITRN